MSLNIEIGGQIMNIYKFTVLLVLTTFLMGSSFAVVKLGLPYASPLLLAALRFILAGILMAVVVLALKRPHPTSKEGWMKMLTIGVFQTTGVMGCIFLSLRTITASESSILTFTNPLLVVIFSTIFTKARYRLHQWCGVFLGLMGVTITMGMQIEGKIGILFGMLSAVFWAIATLLAKKWGSLYLGAISLSNAFWWFTTFYGKFRVRTIIFYCECSVSMHFIMAKHFLVNCSICRLVLSFTK